MDSSRRLLVALSALYLAFAVLIVASAPGLPDRVATHFGLNGAPDGWMSRPGFLGFSLAFPLGLSFVIAGSLYLTRFLPESSINLPNKEYWLAPERRAETFDRLFALGLELACLTMLLMIGVHALLIRANLSPPPQISPLAAISLVAAYLIGVLAIVWRACWRAWRIVPPTVARDDG